MLIAVCCLLQALFGGVHGGSVLDDDHMGALVECLEQLPGKGAVCFFFHEHVTAILKLANGRVRRAKIASGRLKNFEGKNN